MHAQKFATSMAASCTACMQEAIFNPWDPHKTPSRTAPTQAREDVSSEKGNASTVGSDSDDESSWLPQGATASMSMDSSLSAIGAGARSG